MNDSSGSVTALASILERIAPESRLRVLSQLWLTEATRRRYPHQFTWLGRPIIQVAQDVLAMQEIIWRIRPDLVIETGIAHGGSLIFYASLLELLGTGQVLGVDIEIRPHNRSAIEQHPMAHRIRLIEGSSIDPAIVGAVHEHARGSERILVVLDSNHTHDHVLGELRAYSPFVHAGSYLVVFDTAIEDVPAELFPDRPWGPGNNPKTAVHAFLQENDRFEIDKEIEEKLAITVAPDGYLRCVKD